MIVVNSPHNPSTSVLSVEDLDHLARLVHGTPIVLVSDEVYEHMVYDGRRRWSLAGHDELRLTPSVVIGSFGKTFHVTGWKVGAMPGPREITCRDPAGPPVHRVHGQQRGSARTGPGVPGRAGALPIATRILRSQARPPARGWSRRSSPTCLRGQLLPARDLRAGERRAGRRIRQRLIREAGGDDSAVRVLPGRNRPPGDRFCFAKREETLAEAARRLRNLRS